MKAQDLQNNHKRVTTEICKLQSQLEDPRGLPQFICEEASITVNMNNDGSLTIDADGSELNYDQSKSLAQWFRRYY